MCDEVKCESSVGLVPTRVQIPIPSFFFYCVFGAAFSEKDA